MSAAGIPLEERPKGKVPKGKDASTPDMTSALRGYGVGTLRGRPAYMNGYFALQGEPAEKFRGVDMSGRLDQLVMDGRRQVAAIGYAEVDAGIMAIVFGDGGMINAGIYDRIMKAFPRATFHRDPEHPKGPYAVESGGGVVGCAMPIWVPRMPPGLRGLVDPEALRKLDREALKIAEKGLASAKAEIKLEEKWIAHYKQTLKAANTKPRIKRAEGHIAHHEKMLAREHARVAACEEAIAYFGGLASRK